MSVDFKYAFSLLACWLQRQSPAGVLKESFSEKLNKVHVCAGVPIKFSNKPATCTFISKTLEKVLHYKFYEIFKNSCSVDYLANVYLFKITNRNNRKRYEICSKFTIKTPERRQWCRSGVFIVNFKHISYPVLVFLLLTLNM